MAGTSSPATELAVSTAVAQVGRDAAIGHRPLPHHQIRHCGIHVDANQNRVINNDVMFNEGQPAVGVYMRGSGNFASENRLSNVTRGIDVYGDSIITHNLISGAGTTSYLIFAGSGSMVFESNVLRFGGYGIHATGATGAYRNNITFGVTAPYSGAGLVNAGNNQ